MQEFTCEFCLKELKSKHSYNAHKIRCPQNPDRYIAPPKTQAWKDAMDARKGCIGTNQFTKAKELRN